jgi:hypothetical protein
MKKILIAIILTSSFSVIAAEKTNQKHDKHEKQEAAKPSFQRNYGLAGCGLGSVVVGKHGAQIFAATTNGTFFNQTFAISAGSLNCIDSATATVASRMDQFINVNKSQLQGDIAKGNGETISAISSYMGCEQFSKEVGQSLKTNYSTIFTKENKANDITDSIINLIKLSPELSAKCNNLG